MVAVSDPTALPKAGDVARYRDEFDQVTYAQQQPIRAVDTTTLSSSPDLLAIHPATAISPRLSPASPVCFRLCCNGSVTRFFALGALVALAACGDAFSSAGSGGDGGTTTSSSSSSSSSSGSGGATGACGPGYSCVGEDWLGPVVVTQADGDAEPAPCPADFPSEVDRAAKGLTWAPAQCADCSCSGTDLGQCAGGTVHLLDTCGGNVVSTSVSSVCTSLSAFTGVEWVTPPEILVNSGTCAPSGGGAVNLPEASWDTQLRVCGSVDASDLCTEGTGICVPVSDPAGQRPLCIYRAGDVQCPQTGPFKNRYVAHHEASEGRGCSACACSEPGCSGSAVRVFGEQACLAQDLLTSVSPGAGCQTVPSARSAQLSYKASCEPSGGQATGEVVASGPITLCCAT